jgi:hypothetical protein
MQFCLDCKTIPASKEAGYSNWLQQPVTAGIGPSLRRILMNDF